MNISPKERFLDICHFKRPGDLYMLSAGINNIFWDKALEAWLQQGAPKEIMNPRFCRDYFRFQPIRWLSEIISGIWEVDGAGEGVLPEIDLDHGTTVRASPLSPLVPAYEPRIISEDERTVTLINTSGQTVKYRKGHLDRMPAYHDWPVKDRATWNEY